MPKQSLIMWMIPKVPPYFNMTKLFKSFVWAKNGLSAVWKEEENFRTELLCAAVLVVLAAYFNFSTIEWVIVVAIITIVLTGEIVNTVIEDLCNKIEPHQDPTIGKIKDMAAGFVLITSLGAGTMGTLLIVAHFLK